MKILQYPQAEETLRKVSTEAKDSAPTLEAVQLLWQAMNESKTAKALTAIQIGIPLRICVMKMADGESRNFINPEIKVATGRMKFNETCESFKAYKKPFKKKRKQLVEIEYSDVDFKRQKITLNGIDAVCMQHEIDHMDGILVID